MRALRATAAARGERGFTLLEFLLVLTITTLVMGSVAMTVYQLSKLTIKGQSELKVQHQFQNVASWLNRDVVSASEAVVGSTTLTLTLPYHAFGRDQVVISNTIGYSFNSENGTLTRTADGTSQIIGREISSISFGPVGTVMDALGVTVTTSYRGTERATALRFDLRASH